MGLGVEGFGGQEDEWCRIWGAPRVASTPLPNKTTGTLIVGST